MKGFILYKIFYGDVLVYVGRTKQDLQQRLRGHFFAKPMHRIIDIFNTTRIEYASCKTEADMYLYEVYYINKHHPPLNLDDRAGDDLTMELPELEWLLFDCKLKSKWEALLSPEEINKMYERRGGRILRLKNIMEVPK